MVLSQLVPELTLTFQRLTVPTDPDQFAMVKTVNQVLDADHQCQSAMVTQELMEHQELIAYQVLFQHVMKLPEEQQVPTVPSEQKMHQLLLHQLLLCKVLVDQPVATDSPSIASQSALNLKQLDALNQELQPPFQ